MTMNKLFLDYIKPSDETPHSFYVGFVDDVSLHFVIYATIVIISIDNLFIPHFMYNKIINKKLNSNTFKLAKKLYEKIHK